MNKTYFALVDSKIHLMVDMDGVCVAWGTAKNVEELLQKNYFRDQPPYAEVVQAVKGLLAFQYLDVYILSSYLTESQYALQEKNEWLDVYLPGIDQEHRIFIPCGEGKGAEISKRFENFGKTFFLLDDYTRNLVEWSELGGTAIKLRNGINGTNGTWKGESVSRFDAPENIKQRILEIISNHIVNQ